MIRPAKLPQDEPAILSFIRGLQEHEAAFEPNRRNDPDFAADHWRDAQERCAERHGIMLIAEEEGRALGWVFAHEAHGELFIAEPERRHGFLAEIFVLPEARGKGLGRRLIEGVEAWSRERGHKLVTIAVLAQNARAIRAYQASGYTPYTTTLRRYL
ncbi:MAG TPA: GNAT family N-acetyltransferase [Rhizomicrobium sp.]|jgi:GNAT superfamily N-acetyltransferase|nr:GNAT family N-acetyltransferase [Rhizomicrobium sp.]